MQGDPWWSLRNEEKVGFQDVQMWKSIVHWTERQALISWLTNWGHEHKGLNLFLIRRRDQKHISFLGKQWGTQHTLNKYYDPSLRANLVTTPVLRCCYLLSIGILSPAKHVSVSSLFADTFLFPFFFLHLHCGKSSKFNHSFNLTSYFGGQIFFLKKE